MAVDDDEELTVDDLEEESGEDDVLIGQDTEEDENSEPSWGPTMVVNDTTYAVTLFWQPLQDTNDPYPRSSGNSRQFHGRRRPVLPAAGNIAAIRYR